MSRFSPLEACRILSLSLVFWIPRWATLMWLSCQSQALKHSLCQIHAVLLAAHPALQPSEGLSVPAPSGNMVLGLWWLLAADSSSLAESLTVPGTEETLCKDVSNEERKALQVQSVGLAPRVGVLVAGKVGVANPVSQRWVLGGCGQLTSGRSVWKGVERDCTFFPWIRSQLLSKVKHRSTFYSCVYLLQNTGSVLTLEYISLC